MIDLDTLRRIQAAHDAQNDGQEKAGDPRNGVTGPQLVTQLTPEFIMSHEPKATPLSTLPSDLVNQQPAVSAPAPVSTGDLDLDNLLASLPDTVAAISSVPESQSVVNDAIPCAPAAVQSEATAKMQADFAATIGKQFAGDVSADGLDLDDDIPSDLHALLAPDAGSSVPVPAAAEASETKAGGPVPSDPDASLGDIAELVDFDAEFQTLVAAHALGDVEFLRQAAEVLRPEYLDELRTEQILVGLAVEHFKKHGAALSDTTVLKTVLKDAVNGKIISKGDLPGVTAKVTELRKVNLDNRSFVAEKIAEFARHKAVEWAMVGAFKKLDKRDYAGIQESLNRAIAIGKGAAKGEAWFDVAACSLGKLGFNEDPKPKRWVIEGLLQLGITGYIGAPGGTGKSFLAQHLAYGVATGLPVCGIPTWRIGETGDTLYLAAEDDEEEFHTRHRAILGHWRDDPALAARVDDLERMVLDRVFLKCLRGEQKLFTDVVDRQCQVTPLVEKLLKAISDHKFKLIMVDTKSRFSGGDENSNADAAVFVEALEIVSKATGATVLVLHHTTKTAPGKRASAGSLRGASALHDNTRWGLIMETLTREAASKEDISGDTNEVVRITHAKAKGTRGHTPELLRRTGTGVLVAEVRDAFASMKAAMGTANNVLSLVEAEADAGRVYSRRELSREFCGKTGRLRLAQNELRAEIDSLVDQGHLTEVEVRPASGKPKLVLQVVKGPATEAGVTLSWVSDLSGDDLDRDGLAPGLAPVIDIRTRRVTSGKHEVHIAPQQYDSTWGSW